MMKGNKQQTENKLNELIVKFNKINNNKHINKIEMDRKDIEPKEEIIIPISLLDNEI